MKIGFLSLPLTGHLNPMTALARKIQSRGHEVVFIGVPDIESVVRAADLEFVPFCESEYPLGTVAKTWSAVANLHGLDVIRYTTRKLTPGLVKAALEHLPGKIAESGVDSLILDTAYQFLGVVPSQRKWPKRTPPPPTAGIGIRRIAPSANSSASQESDSPGFGLLTKLFH
jgi:zeaxanthin glucosyltransferase